MAFPLAAAIGAGASLLGGLFGSSSAKSQQQAQAAHDIELQKNNIAWEREQHQTRHQWEMEDYKKAGLNPILTATGGSGGSISSASQGSSISSDQGANIREAFTGLGHSAQAAFQNKLQQEQNAALIDKSNAERDNIRMDTKLKRESYILGEVQARIDNIRSQTGSHESQQALFDQQTEVMKNEVINSAARLGEILSTISRNKAAARESNTRSNLNSAMTSVQEGIKQLQVWNEKLMAEGLKQAQSTTEIMQSEIYKNMRKAGLDSGVIGTIGKLLGLGAGFKGSEVPSTSEETWLDRILEDMYPGEQ